MMQRTAVIPVADSACLRIAGGVRLRGSVAVSGAKNAALPIMAACVLAEGPVQLARVPRLTDVDSLALLLGYLGVEVKPQLDGRLLIQTVDPRPMRADAELVSQLRASFCVLGPLLARRGCATVALPGGCAIGERPIDLHLRGLAALGADLRIADGYCFATARRLRGATIDLLGPYGPTVTGTANVMCAATRAVGRTVITGAAREPEIVDLGGFLNALGARITGLGTSTLEIEGVEQLGGADYTIIPDRIEAATLALAAVATRGDVTLTGVATEHMTAVLDVLAEFGAQIVVAGETLRVICEERPRPLAVTARPYPGLPTDVQAQVTAVATLAAGRSRVSDAVFGERFAHVDELRRFGAQVGQQGSAVTIDGVARLRGAAVTACDLRASAALVLAGLAAEGVTTIAGLDHLDRGYEGLETKLQTLGARIARVTPASGALSQQRVDGTPPGRDALWQRGDFSPFSAARTAVAH